MGFLSKVFGGIKKIIKGVGKIIKKGAKKIGGFFKRVFKGVGKFIGKLGPIGMLGMMLIMPQLGAWWSQFGAWAGNLTGPLGGFMKGVHAAGSFVGKAYTTVTEGINTVVGGFAESVGLGDAYTRATGFLGEKMTDLQSKLGLHTVDSAAALKSSLDPIQEITVTAQKRPVLGDTTVKPDAAVKAPEIKEITVDAKFKGSGKDLKESIMAGRKELGLSTEGYELSSAAQAHIKADSKSFIDKVKGVSGKIEAVKQLASDLGITEQEASDILGYGNVADLALPVENTVMQANSDWTINGGVGNPTYGPASSFFQQSIRQFQAEHDPTYNYWYDRFAPRPGK